MNGDKRGITELSKTTSLPPLYFVNGQAKATVSLDDRGFAYGDGLFESMLLEGSRIALLEFHLARLKKGCELLKIGFLRELIIEQVELALRYAVREDVDYAKVKLTVTRGVGGRATYPPQNATPSIFIHILPISRTANSDDQDDGRVKLSIAPEPLVCPPQLAGLKHLNRLPYILGCLELSPTDQQEVLFLDANQNIIETMHHNIFFVKNDVLYTPKLASCGVEGVMKRVVCEHLIDKLDVSVEEKNIPITDVNIFDEVFISNAVKGLTPVDAIAQHQFNCHVLCKKLSIVFEKIKSDL